MSGMVGVICDDAGRYSLFTYCLTRMEHPPNTKLEMIIGSDRSVGRNRAVTRMMEMGAEWIFFVDDDHVFPPKILMQLLEADVDVVGALYCQRQAPFAPIAYERVDDEGGYHSIFLPDLPPDELVEVRSLGTGGMLIRAEVLHAMDGPWFQHTSEKSEDHFFCDRLVDAEIPIYVHTGVRMGHLAPSSVWPSYDEAAGWQIGFSVADQFSIAIGIEKERAEVE